MSDLAVPRNAARPRFRAAITTLLLVMLAILIVRDIFARRFSSSTPSRPDVTRRLS